MREIENLEAFNKRLKSITEESIVHFVRRHIIHGTPYIFNDREEAFYDFRKRIAEKWNVNFYDIYITGSANLGFSYWNETIFSYESDIDISIISSNLYEDILNHIDSFQWNIRDKNILLDKRDSKQYHKFLEYMAIGWIRPDKIPLQIQRDNMKLKNDWFDFFNSISYGKSEVGNYKVTAGIFKSYSHFERYILNGIKKCQLKLKNKIDNDKE
ncbi:hypothetical protein V6W59_03655 [Mannheimia sp. HC-2023]|uniref:hypothetical protein n=1 Tax=Mannheimia indoligenes TaxID=3103145 RepID=UPI002FE5CA1D